MRIACTALALAFSSLFACSDHVGTPAQVTDEYASDAGVDAPRVPVAPAGPLARSAVIQEVALFQGTRIQLAREGSKVGGRRMPVVEGRDALVRAYLTPQGAGLGKTITGELYVVRGTSVVAIIKDTVVMNGPSREEAPESTFDFEVPGAHLARDTSFVVRLLEDGVSVVPPSTASLAQYPKNGVPEVLGVERVADKLRVVLVPVQYGGDGTNRLPDTSPNVLDAIRKRLLEFYPVPDVELTLHAPIVHSGPILGTGPGWDEVLQRVTQLRLSENAAPDVYYYGAFAPANSLREFCTGSCILGLSNAATDAADSTQRVSVGALYAANDAIDTVPHEIGHAHGRQHAPCGGSAGNDPAYPYGGAITQTWGYSIVTKSLKPPTFFDQMSYCMPAWQSDYTYIGLAERIRAVSELRIAALSMEQPTSTPAAPARTYRMARVSANGELAWAGEPFQTTTKLSGDEQRVTFVNETGASLGDENAHGYTYSHLSGATLIVPYDGAAKAARRVRFTPSPSRHLTGEAMEIVRRRLFNRDAELVLR